MLELAIYIDYFDRVVLLLGLCFGCARCENYILPYHCTAGSLAVSVTLVTWYGVSSTGESFSHATRDQIPRKDLDYKISALIIPPGLVRDIAVLYP